MMEEKFDCRKSELGKMIGMKTARQRKSGIPLKNLKGENSIPEELNLEWVKTHVHIHLIGKDLRWSITACRNIIILEIRKHWTPKDIKEYVDNISGLPALLLEKWNKIFLIFDVSLMEFAIKDAPRFLQSNWLRVQDREDMSICIVEKKKLSRFLWKQLHRQISKLNRIGLFSDCDAALTWIRSEIINYVGDSSGNEDILHRS